MPSGRRRKGDLDLKDCELLELTQFDCFVEERAQKKKQQNQIVCDPIVRLFRRYVRAYLLLHLSRDAACFNMIC